MLCSFLFSFLVFFERRLADRRDVMRRRKAIRSWWLDAHFFHRPWLCFFFSSSRPLVCRRELAIINTTHRQNTIPRRQTINAEDGHTGASTNTDAHAPSPASSFSPLSNVHVTKVRNVFFWGGGMSQPSLIHLLPCSLSPHGHAKSPLARTVHDARCMYASSGRGSPALSSHTPPRRCAGLGFIYLDLHGGVLGVPLHAHLDAVLRHHGDA